MNVPVDVAHRVIDSLQSKPFLLGLLVLNLVVLGGFAITLHEVSNAMERRERLLERCLK